MRTTDPAPAVPVLLKSDKSTPRSPVLWPAIIVLALYWIAYSVVALVELPYFLRFMFGVAAPLLVILFCTIWWWLNRRIPLKKRVLGFLIVVGGGALAAIISHPSVGMFGIVTGGAPIVLTALIVWMEFSKKTSVMVARAGVMTILLLGWGYFTLLRIDGVNGDLQTNRNWRWAPSAEQLFLAERATRGSRNSSSVTVNELSGDDWPDFRGQSREGAVSHINIEPDWKAHPPKLLWRQRIGPAWSSVIVVGNRLFTQEQRGEREAVVCYDADSGSQIWVHEDPVRFSEQVSGAGPRATPTFAKGKIYALGAKGILNCLNADDGKKVWSRDIKSDSGATDPMWGFSSSPLIMKGHVIVYGGGTKENLLAYDAETGKPAWTAAAGNSSYSSPHPATLAGKPQVLMVSDSGLMSFDPEQGKMLWQYGKPMAGAPMAPQPHIYDGGKILVSSMVGQGISSIEVSCGDNHWKPAERWAANSMKPEFPDFVIHQGFAYGFDGAIFCCVDLSNGERKWKGGRYGRGQVILLAEQSLLLVMSERGEAILLAATPDKQQELGRFQALDGKCWSHPIVVRNHLFARNAEEIACYELAGAAGATVEAAQPAE